MPVSGMDETRKGVCHAQRTLRRGAGQTSKYVRCVDCSRVEYLCFCIGRHNPSDTQQGGVLGPPRYGSCECREVGHRLLTATCWLHFQVVLVSECQPMAATDGQVAT
jgi:hypothetical protein